MNWSEHTLGEIGSFRGGGTPATSIPEYWNGHIPWTTSKNLGDRFFLDSGERLTSELGLKNSSSSLIPTGNLLIGTRVGVGKVAVNRVAMAISQDLTGVVVHHKRFDPLFLAFCIAQPSIQTEIQRHARGVTIQGITRDDLKSIRFHAPHLAEQREIAAVLGKIQEAVEVEGDLIRVTRELKQAALRQLFTRGLRGERQRETEIGRLPESWRILPLSDAVLFASGGTPSKYDPKNWGGDIPWVSPKDMKRPRLFDTIDHITQQGLDSGSRLVPAGTILVVIRGMILMRDVPVALTMVPVAFNQDMKAILPGDGLNPEFLLYAFEAFRPQLFTRVGTSAHGTRTLASSSLENFVVPVPELLEQRDIATQLAVIDAKLKHHEARQKLLQELFRSLLCDLMTGRRRVAGVDLPL